MIKQAHIFTPKFKGDFTSDLCSYIKKTDFKILTGPTADIASVERPLAAATSNDELSVIATSKDDVISKHIHHKTEESPYIEVPVRVDTLECSFGSPQEYGVSRVDHFCDISDPRLSLRESQRRAPTDQRSDSQDNTQKYLKKDRGQSPMSNSAKNIPDQSIASVSQDFSNVENPGRVLTEEKLRLTLGISNKGHLGSGLFFLLAFIITGFIYQHSSDSYAFEVLNVSLAPIISFGISYSFMKKIVFMKKFSKVLCLWDKKRFNEKMYSFPLSYRFCQILGVLLGVALPWIFVSKKSTWSISVKIIIAVVISLGISYTTEVLFTLYYVKIYKKSLKKGKPKGILEIRGVKQNIYNEFLDDLNYVKFQYSNAEKGEVVNPKSYRSRSLMTAVQTTLETKMDEQKVMETKESARQPPANLPEKAETAKINHLPSMSLKHIFAQNLMILVMGTGSAVYLFLSWLTQNDITQSMTLALGSLAGLPLLYGTLSLVIKALEKYLKFYADIMADMLLFAHILVPYKAIVFTLSRSVFSPVIILPILISSKIIWKIICYIYRLYQLKPKTEQEKATDMKTKQKADKGGIVEVYKRKHLNFGVQFTFWQQFDIMLSLVYMILLPLTGVIDIKQALRDSWIIYSFFALLIDAVLEAMIFQVLKRLFVKFNPGLKKFDFSIHMYSYIWENLGIFVTSLFFALMFLYNPQRVQAK